MADVMITNGVVPVDPLQGGLGFPLEADLERQQEDFLRSRPEPQARIIMGKRAAAKAVLRQEASGEGSGS